MKNKAKLLLAALVAALIFLIAGCDSSAPAVNQPAANTSQKAETQTQPGSVTPNPDNPERAMQLTVYYATKDAMHLVPETYKVPVNSQPARTAIELLLAGPKNAELVGVMPQGVKLKNIVIKEHIAYVDFDEKLIKKNIGGSTSEILLVAAIVNTLTEFPDIQKVQILVEGKKIQTISGHLDLSEPLSRSEQIIKK